MLGLATEVQSSDMGAHPPDNPATSLARLAMGCLLMDLIKLSQSTIPQARGLKMTK